VSFIGDLATLLYSPKNSNDRKALDKAVERGQLHRIRAGVYTDELQRSADEVAADHLPAVLALAFPAWTISHSTAALLKPVNGSAFISGKQRTTNPAKLQSITVHRLASLPHPESIQVDLGDMVARSLTAEPEPVRVRLSSPLQNVFELLDSDARQPDRTLPVETIRGLIDTLSETDKLRASSFAERNRLLAELARFNALRAGSESFVPGATRTYESLDLYFYHWHVGTLDSLPAREFRFAYHDGWGIPLPGLPLQHSRASYEGPGLPAFFDNLLPEGWAESRLQAVHKIAREDTFALLRTTQKYLSNFTLRSREFEESRLVLDYLDVTLADFNQTDKSASILIRASCGSSCAAVEQHDSPEFSQSCPCISRTRIATCRSRSDTLATRAHTSSSCHHRNSRSSSTMNGQRWSSLVAWDYEFHS
jgi:HipA-like protein